MPLTDVAIRNADPGLSLTNLAILSACSCWCNLLAEKLWRLKYRVDGKEKKLSIAFSLRPMLGE